MMPATYLLDSDICILAVRKRDESLRAVIQDMRNDGLAISVISYGEVREGALYSRAPERDLRVWQSFTEGLDVIDVTLPVADLWAQIRGALRLAGNKVPDNDLLIAATAMRFGMVVVSRNVRHFGRIAGLDLLVP